MRIASFIVSIAAVCLPLVGAAEITAAPSPAKITDTEPEPEIIEVRSRRVHEEGVQNRAVHRTTRKQLDERQVRSAPDALRYSPGVHVQQTGHAQGSPYVRGRTGQHVLLMFDGLRLNHALFRQGPNQYFFTVDSRTIDSIEVIRGATSVELGADAMSGAIVVKPLDPRIDPYRTHFHLQPKVELRHITADEEVGGRLQLDTQLGASTGLLTGVGYRTVGQLESAGSVGHLLSEQETDVPLFEKEVPTMEPNGRVQMGTGFEELTADARLVHRTSTHGHLTLAAYVYRQYDSPRTDQCPPPAAPLDECLKYLEQFRTSVVGRGKFMPGWALLDQLDVSAGFQRQHERRQRDMESSLGSINGGRDDIDVWAVRARGGTHMLVIADWLETWLEFGLDGTREAVSSAGWTTLTRQNATFVGSRGQYLDGSTYTQGGAWLSPKVKFGEQLLLRTGGRVAFASVYAPKDHESETVGIDKSWVAVVGNAGIEWTPYRPLTLTANIEQGFRPPNLDDLTARQATGHGYQVENPELIPERALTLELGARWATRRASIEGWMFQQYLPNLMERRRGDCPESDLECGATDLVVMLDQDSGTAGIHGVELSGWLRPGWGVSLRGTASYAVGDRDTSHGGVSTREPISRIPPLNGTIEARWSARESGLYAGTSLRWARDQTRLSLGDRGDTRIPFGGTPGYTALDLRAGLRLPQELLLALILENVTDEPTRGHGSSVNGPGRGLIVTLQYEPQVGAQ